MEMIALCVIVEVFVSLNLETDTIRYNKSVNHDLFSFLFLGRVKRKNAKKGTTEEEED